MSYPERPDLDNGEAPVRQRNDGESATQLRHGFIESALDARDMANAAIIGDSAGESMQFGGNPAKVLHATVINYLQHMAPYADGLGELWTEPVGEARVAPPGEQRVPIKRREVNLYGEPTVDNPELAQRGELVELQISPATSVEIWPVPWVTEYKAYLESHHPHKDGVVCKEFEVPQVMDRRVLVKLYRRGDAAMQDLGWLPGPADQQLPHTEI